MTLARRLAAIETGLSPTQRVLAWLDEAQVYRTLVAYVDSLIAEDPDEYPLDRLARETSAGVRASLRGKPPEVVNPAVRKVLGETLFRFELVMRINVVSHELMDRQLLLDAVFASHLAMLGGADRRERREEHHRRRLALSRNLVLGRVTELLATAQARGLAESRFLDGHPALFPDAVRAWDEQLLATQKLGAMAMRVGELDGIDPPPPEDPDGVSTRAAALLADLVEPAKSTALEKLGEGGPAMRIATNWLRAKAELQNTRGGGSIGGDGP